MTGAKKIATLFYAAALYDAILGLAFLFAADWVFTAFWTEPPNHFGYVHFPAALLLVFALMFLAIARDPQQNRNLILYGVLLKVSYCGVVFWHWWRGGIPYMWKPFAIFDLVFAVLFCVAYVALKKQEEEADVVRRES